MYDIIVVGAGPAGVSAALYAKSRGFNGSNRGRGHRAKVRRGYRA